MQFIFITCKGYDLLWFSAQKYSYENYFLLSGIVADFNNESNNNLVFYVFLQLIYMDI